MSTEEMTNDIESANDTGYNSEYLLETFGYAQTKDGTVVYLTQQPYISISNQGDTIYESRGVDMGGNVYQVTWSPLEGLEQSDDESDACDWLSPDSVIRILAK